MNIYKDLPNPLSYLDFETYFLNARKELNEAIRFLERCHIDNPIHLFNESDKYLKSPWNAITSIMKAKALNDDSYNVHTFQILLASILNKAFQNWKSDEKIDGNFSIQSRNHKSFPSIFAIYHDDYDELIQFNIFEKYYGIRVPVLSEEMVIQNYKKNIESNQESLDETIKTIEYWESVIKKPSILFKTPIDAVRYYLKRDTILQNIDKKLNDLNLNKEDIESNIKSIEESIPEQIKRNLKRKEMIELVIPFFKSLNYLFQEDKHKLY